MYPRESSKGISGRGLRSRVAALAYGLGILRAGRALGPRSLTVVNYHRLGDVNHPGFDSFKPNISAHPDEFDRQMGYLKRWFNVITIETLVEWLEGKAELPLYPALITFDDGYLDNYTQAYPLLRQYGLPALIFLTTGHIGTQDPFPWDVAAYSFYHTALHRVTLPDGREMQWSDGPQVDATIKAWVEALKPLPPADKDMWTGRLPEQLGVAIPDGHFRGLMLNWDQVREMRAGGISFGGHTVTHPILTRIRMEPAAVEIQASKVRIEEETGVEVLAFAYPNGMSGDFSKRLITAVAGARYRVAFTLLNGPAYLREVRERPFEIRRIFVSHRHTLSDFAALLSPLNRLWPG